MEGYRGIPPSSVIPFFWAPGWNSVQSINKYQIETGGPLHGGDPGKRLIPINGYNPIPTSNETAGNTGAPFFAEQPEPFQPRAGCIYLIPWQYIFGTDELSMQTPGIAERSPSPHITLAAEDPHPLGLTEGAMLAFQYKGQEYSMPLQTSEHCPRDRTHTRLTPSHT